MTESQGTFDMLNDALFAQIDKLQSIDPHDAEQMERCIEQSRAVSQLASNVISNANTAINVMRMYEQAGMDLDSLAGRTPKMLKGHY